MLSTCVESKTQYRKLINKKADEELPFLTEEKLMTLHLRIERNNFYW